MEFEYRTRGGSSPEGKARVCVVVNPSDEKNYLEPLCEQILTYQNCAIWLPVYDLASINSEDDFDFSQMQLFVIAVTESFLTTYGYATYKILTYSNRFQIPVLPILYEAGIDDLYAESFGTLHYLSPVTNDTYTTDISFEQKLETFLQKTLVGDKERAEIDNAFDAFMFMSYRKKDREEALALMKKIHQNPRFQGVAIWYDEFLVPGDSFLDGISDKLSSCDLFTMVVTPHLLEPGNFVMNKEYKDAAASNKKIFPVEMVRTDNIQLQQCYANIPPCIPYTIDSLLDAKLSESLSAKLPASGKRDAASTYLLGLAYLNGINVEINTERARLMFVDSLSAGYIPAYKKLITMYREGHGVKRQLEYSLYWQKLLIDRLTQRYETEPSPLLRKELFIELFDIIEFYEKEQQIEKAESYIMQMQTLAGDALNYEDAIIYSRFLLKLAVFERAKRNFNQARTHFNDCIKLREQLVNLAPGLEEKAENMRALSAAHLCLGDMEHYDILDYPEAQEHYALAGEIRQTLVNSCPKGSPAELGYRRDFANACWRMADLMFTASGSSDRNYAQQTIAASDRFYRTCLDERLKILAEARTEEAKDEVASAYLGLAKLHLYYGDINIAEKSSQNALSLIKEIVASRGSTRDNWRLARAHELHGSILSKMGRCREDSPEAFTQAMQELEQACKIITAILQKNRTASYVEYLSELYRITGDICQQWHQPLMAIYYYKQAYPLCKEIVTAQKPANKQVYIEKNQALGSLLLSMGNLKENPDRISHLKEASYIWYGLSTLYPDIPNFYNNYEEIQKLINKLLSGDS